MANPAINLQQVIQFFDPAQPLRGQDLQTWFVQRPQTPRALLRVFLQAQRDPVKILFVGHRGSGKSTELNKLSSELDDTHFPIHLDMLEVVGRSTPGYEDLMLALSTHVTRTCIDAGLVGRPLSEPLREQWHHLSNWWRRIVSGLQVQPRSGDTDTYASLSILLGEIEIGARQSSFTRDRIRDQIIRRMPELIRYLNMVIAEAHAALNPRRLLLLVEGLDKVDLKAALNIFRDHAPTITALETAMIYTFPLALRHSDDYRTVRGYFDNDHFLHNIATHHADGSDDEEGLAALRQLVRARMDMILVEDMALDQLVRASGGIPVELVKLVRNAAIYALVRSEQARQIILDDVQHAIQDLRRETSIPLSRSDWQVLHTCRPGRELTNDPEMQRLFYNGALIEYSNGTQWCDVHPVLWDVLDEYAEEE